MNGSLLSVVHDMLFVPHASCVAQVHTDVKASDPGLASFLLGLRLRNKWGGATIVET